MSNEVKCARCNGEGRQHYEEDDRPVSDVCYCCGGTGRVDQDSAHSVHMQAVCEILARVAVDAERKACNDDPEGEGWAFCAAENMLTEQQYTHERCYHHAAKFEPELAKLSREAQEALIGALGVATEK